MQSSVRAVVAVALGSMAATVLGASLFLLIGLDPLLGIGLGTLVLAALLYARFLPADDDSGEPAVETPDDNSSYRRK